MVHSRPLPGDDLSEAELKLRQAVKDRRLVSGLPATTRMIEFVLVRAGSFTMGRTNAEVEKASSLLNAYHHQFSAGAHRVEVASPFFIARRRSPTRTFKISSPTVRRQKSSPSASAPRCQVLPRLRSAELRPKARARRPPSHPLPPDPQLHRRFASCSRPTHHLTRSGISPLAKLRGKRRWSSARGCPKRQG